MSASDVCNKEVGSTSKSNDDVCEVIGKLDNMSTNNEGIPLVCAKCGKEGSEVTNTCNKCKMVMYCNAACKKRHRHKHKKECEEHVKRAAEKDEKLFKQPPPLEEDEKLFKQPPPLEDCPICMVRLPTMETGSTYMGCCGKIICCGCIDAPVYDNEGNVIDDVCPFCRTPPCSNDEVIKRYEDRAALNDATAMYILGIYYSTGEEELPQDDTKALELWHQAAELGYADAYYLIGNAYILGNGVEMDEKKALYYYKLSAMGGNIKGRFFLGIDEEEKGNPERALKHYIIATKDGCVESLESIKRLGHEGTEVDLFKAVQYHLEYLDDVRSDQRDEAAETREKYYELLSNFNYQSLGY